MNMVPPLVELFMFLYYGNQIAATWMITDIVCNLDPSEIRFNVCVICCKVSAFVLHRF